MTRRLQFAPEVQADIEELMAAGADFEDGFRAVAEALEAGAVPTAQRDHPLKGQLSGWAACDVGYMPSGRTVVMVYYLTPRNHTAYVVAVDEHDASYRKAKQRRAEGKRRTSRRREKARKLD